jgi:hypothetical protein
MKKEKMIKFLKILKVIMIIIFLMSLDGEIYSQPGMPPGHGQDGDQGAGGFAPLGEGLFVLLVSAMAYGIRKIRANRKKET